MKRKYLVLLAIGFVAVAGTFGGYTAVNASSDAEAATGPEAEAAAAAALALVGGGTILEVEHADDPGATWEVEIRNNSGVGLEVLLDSDLNEIGIAPDDGGNETADSDSGNDKD